MMKTTRIDALAIAEIYAIPLDVDFHVLPQDTVRRVLDAANANRYRAPRNANGSRARYYHAMLRRLADGPTREKDI